MKMWKQATVLLLTTTTSGSGAAAAGASSVAAAENSALRPNIIWIMAGAFVCSFVLFACPLVRPLVSPHSLWLLILQLCWVFVDSTTCRRSRLGRARIVSVHVRPRSHFNPTPGCVWPVGSSVYQCVRRVSSSVSELLRDLVGHDAACRPCRRCRRHQRHHDYHHHHEKIACPRYLSLIHI